MKPKKNFRQRPRKSGADRKRRVNSQKNRLEKAGYDREELDRMTIPEIRQLLKKAQKEKRL